SGNSSSSLPSGNSNNGGGNNGNNGSNGSNNGSNSSSTPDIQVVSTSSFTVDLGFDSPHIGNMKVGQSASITLSTASPNNRGGAGGLSRQFVADGGLGGASPNGGANANAQNNATAITGTQAASGKVTSVGTIASASSGVASYPVTVAFTDTSGEYHP